EVGTCSAKECSFATETTPKLQRHPEERRAAARLEEPVPAKAGNGGSRRACFHPSRHSRDFVALVPQDDGEFVSLALPRGMTGETIMAAVESRGAGDGKCRRRTSISPAPLPGRGRALSVGADPRAQRS